MSLLRLMATGAAKVAPFLMQDNSVKITGIMISLGAIVGLLGGGILGMFISAGVMMSLCIIFYILKEEVDRNTILKTEAKEKKDEVLQRELKIKMGLMEDVPKKIETKEPENIFAGMLEREPSWEEEMGQCLSVKEYERRAKKNPPK